jgi:hypothetical protein
MMVLEGSEGNEYSSNAMNISFFLLRRGINVQSLRADSGVHPLPSLSPKHLSLLISEQKPKKTRRKARSADPEWVEMQRTIPLPS